jgi:hypothetical protein
MAIFYRNILEEGLKISCMINKMAKEQEMIGISI